MKEIELLYVDLFSGAGGTSTGVETSGVAKVIACVNHDANAIASHAANHPDALHFVEDVRTLDLSKLIKYVAQMRIKYPNAKLVLWASLECTNFSKAKGGQPRDADSRTLAYSLFKHFDPDMKRYFEGVGYIQALKPDYIQIENVEEFMSWGEMDKNGKPLSRQKGSDYMRFVNDICSLGYHTDFRILNSADYGAYTSRKRLFLQFAKHELPITWPVVTHVAKNKMTASKVQSNMGQMAMLFDDYTQKAKAWKPVREVLDFEDEGVSIFNRKKPLADKTLERIYAGLIKFVAGGKDKFLSLYYSGSPNSKNLSVDSAAATITTKDHHSIVSCEFISRYNSGNPEHRNTSIDAPCGVVTTNNRFAKVKCKFLSAYYGNGHNHSPEKPCPTVTTSDRFAFVTANFLDMQYGNGTPSSIHSPAPTLTTNPKHHLISVKQRKFRYLMNPQFNSSGGSIDKPAFTLIARMDKMPPYIVTTCDGDLSLSLGDSDIAKKIVEFMRLYGIGDIKMRMLKIPELKMIMGFPKDYKLIGTQAEQKKFIGNAVEVTMARALCVSTCNGLKKSFKKIAV